MPCKLWGPSHLAGNKMQVLGCLESNEYLGIRQFAKHSTNLHDIGVARYKACGKHPEGNHCREVKRGNASTDAKRHPGRPRSWVLKLLQPMAGQVHVLADTSQGLSQHQCCVCTQRFNHLGIELNTKRCFRRFLPAGLASHLLLHLGGFYPARE